MRFKIKLNDEILDSKKQQKLSSFGTLQKGSNFRDKSMEAKEMKGRQIFDMKMANKVGPQDYNPIKVSKRVKQVIIMNEAPLKQPP